jgi:hypothetical protein
MAHLILHSSPTCCCGPCGLCGRPVVATPGPQLGLADNLTPVCAECGRRHAPALAALVGLADAAERVSRMGRHSVFPPLTGLLDLASAAEKYAANAPPRQREAG